jgi:hypothetical protein
MGTPPELSWDGEGLEVHQVPVISTAHLTEETSKALTALGNENTWCVCASWEHGFFLYLDELDDDVPQCLRDIADWLKRRGFTDCWVRLDSDADRADTLTAYEW